MNFFKNSHFALFVSFGIHVKDTNFTFGTPHTHTYTDTHRHMHTYRQRYRYHFHILHFLAHLAYIPKIFGIPDTYTCTDTQTYVETLTHRYRYTETHACLYTYTNTHTDVHVGNLRKLLLEVSISISGNANFGYSVFQ